MKLNLAIAIWSAIIPLSYSVQVLSFIKDGTQYTCNADSQKNPYADCINLIAAACTPSSIVLSADCVRYNNRVFDYFPLGNPWRSFGDNCLPLRESSTLNFFQLALFPHYQSELLHFLSHMAVIYLPAIRMKITIPLKIV